MQSDLPHTLYIRDKKKRKSKGGNPNENYKYNPNDKAIRLQEEANRKMRERMAQRGEQVQYMTDELFKK